MIINRNNTMLTIYLLLTQQLIFTINQLKHQKYQDKLIEIIKENHKIQLHKQNKKFADELFNLFILI